MIRPGFVWRVLVTERTTALVPVWAALTAALTVVAPMTIGALTGHAAPGVQVSLGAYFLAITSIDIYGARRLPRAAVLAVALVLDTAGYLAGACAAGHPWVIGGLTAVSVFGFLCLDGIPLIRHLGLMPAWCLILGAGRPATADPGTQTLLFLLGGALFCTMHLALVAAPSTARILRVLARPYALLATHMSAVDDPEPRRRARLMASARRASRRASDQANGLGPDPAYTAVQAMAGQAAHITHLLMALHDDSGRRRPGAEGLLDAPGAPGRPWRTIWTASPPESAPAPGHQTSDRRFPSTATGSRPPTARVPSGGSRPWTPPSTPRGTAAWTRSCPPKDRHLGTCRCGPARCPDTWE
ncbi:hypothetical protein ACTVZO_41875 [Streptomyces sp. IBSNAI002]|uniref:hypothetical protein n=1 Tax=Streptomyces sp. IBSNAI002 TaxID=3457500 RepID=UPI003FD2B8A2